MDQDWDALVRGLDRRIDACMCFPFQIRGEPHARLRDPLTGGRALLNRARAVRTRPQPSPGVAGCPYCQGRTPPTLFYVLDGETLLPVVEGEGASLALAADQVRQGDLDTWALLDRLAQARRLDADGLPVPVVLPPEPWSARVFLNATPIAVDPTSAANGFVVSVPAPYHALDLAELAPPPGPSSAAPAPSSAAPSPLAPLPAPSALTAWAAARLPVRVVEALVTAWAVLEAWGDQRGLVSVPFINGGKDRASGQSIDCFHAQSVALGPADRPPVLDVLRASRAGRCALCSLTEDDSLRVAQTGGTVVAAHPAPAGECTLVIAPQVHAASLRQLPELGDLALGISVAARYLASLFGGLPPYNLALRTGSAVGHVHLEMVPRAGVSVAGGFELATGFSVLARDPLAVAARGREWAAQQSVRADRSTVDPGLPTVGGIRGVTAADGTKG